MISSIFWEIFWNIFCEHFFLREVFRSFYPLRFYPLALSEKSYGLYFLFLLHHIPSYIICGRRTRVEDQTSARPGRRRRCCWRSGPRQRAAADAYPKHLLRLLKSEVSKRGWREGVGDKQRQICYLKTPPSENPPHSIFPIVFRGFEKGLAGGGWRQTPRSNKRCFLNGVFQSCAFRGWSGCATTEGTKML